MNELLKAYAHQVASYHPAAQRDDLFAEVYDELCEEFEDWRASHPGGGESEYLNENRVHPMKYATRLAEDGSAYLVGPQFYFSFVSALKIALSVVVVAYLVFAAFSVLTGTHVWPALWGMLTSLPGTMLWVGASILGVFVAMEKSGESATWLDKWDASELRPFDGHQEVSRFETSFDLAFSTFLLLWILDVVNVPTVVRHDGDWISGWSMNLPDALWIIAGLMAAFDIAFSLYRLGRTLWTPRLRMVTIAGNVVWLALLAHAVTLPGLLSVEHESAAQFLSLAEKAFKGGLMVAIALIAWETLSHAWRLLRGAR